VASYSQQTEWRRQTLMLPHMPTYRQVTYWSEHGVLGDEHARPGSGHWQTWTPHELAKLGAIGAVAEDVRAAGFPGLPQGLVRRLWELLDQSSIATIRVGSVAITASLPETGEQP